MGRAEPAERTAREVGASRTATRPALLVGLVVLVATLIVAVHRPALDATAVSADDDNFVTNNSLVTNPSWDSVRRFFVEVLHPSTVAGYYLPVSMTSLMLDYAAGGRTVQPRAFHRTSLALHVAVSLLIFVFLFRLFGSAIPAALAALAFGVHPLTVEPIAWISERKTLLAALFGVGCLIGYVESVRRGSGAWRVVSIASFALALLSKPSVTTLPLLLIVLDAWPLKRLRLSTVIEKWPYVLLAAISGVVSVLSLTGTESVGGTSLSPLGWVLRIGFLLTFYLGKALWPGHLSVVYPPPYPFTLANAPVLASLVVACAVTAVSYFMRRRAPGAWTGWLFTMAALIPTFGILAWSRLIAWDRYLYFPGVGLVLALAWGLAAGWDKAARGRRVAIAVAMLVVLVAETRATRTAQGAWTNSLVLWRNAVAVAPAEAWALNGLGTAYGREESFAEAAGLFRRAIASDPTFLMGQRNLGTSLVSMGRLDEANPHLRRAEALAPMNPDVAYDLGWAAHEAGKLDSAAAHYERALRLAPNHASSLIELGIVRTQQGRTAEGIEILRRAETLAPNHAGARLSLSMALLHEGGHDAEAIDGLRRTLLINPDWLAPLNRLAWLLATHPDAALRDGVEASRLAVRLVDLTGGREPQALDTRAAAEAAAGRFDEARVTAAKALDLALAVGDDSLAVRIRGRIGSYDRREPYTEPVQRSF